MYKIESELLEAEFIQRSFDTAETKCRSKIKCKGAFTWGRSDEDFVAKNKCKSAPFGVGVSKRTSMGEGKFCTKIRRKCLYFRVFSHSYFFEADLDVDSALKFSVESVSENIFAWLFPH